MIRPATRPNTNWCQKPKTAGRKIPATRALRAPAIDAKCSAISLTSQNGNDVRRLKFVVWPIGQQAASEGTRTADKQTPNAYLRAVLTVSVVRCTTAATTASAADRAVLYSFCSTDDSWQPATANEEQAERWTAFSDTACSRSRSMGGGGSRCHGVQRDDERERGQQPRRPMDRRKATLTEALDNGLR